MINELVYCPRLFHLEWVSQLFADNEFTAVGAQVGDQRVGYGL